MKSCYRLSLYPRLSRSNQKLPYQFVVRVNAYFKPISLIENSQTYIKFEKSVNHNFLFKSKKGVIDEVIRTKQSPSIMYNWFTLPKMLRMYDVKQFLSRLSNYKEYSYSDIKCVTDNFQTIELLLKTIPIYFHPKMRKYALSPKSLNAWQQAIKPIIKDIKVP